MYFLYQDLRWVLSQPSGIGPTKQRRVVRYMCVGDASSCRDLLACMSQLHDVKVRDRYQAESSV